MAKAIAYPTYACTAGGAVLVISSPAQLAQVGTAYALTPFPAITAMAPADSRFAATDLRLQQVLIEARIRNTYLFAGLGTTRAALIDDPTVLRADVLANDSGLLNAVGGPFTGWVTWGVSLLMAGLVSVIMSGG